MTVRVEFFGIPRQRAGLAMMQIEAGSLGAAVTQIATQFPQLAEECIHADTLHDGYLANVNGLTFTRDPSYPLNDGDTLLILSADVGG